MFVGLFLLFPAIAFAAPPTKTAHTVSEVASATANRTTSERETVDVVIMEKWEDDWGEEWEIDLNEEQERSKSAAYRSTPQLTAHHASSTEPAKNTEQTDPVILKSCDCDSPLQTDESVKDVNVDRTTRNVWIATLTATTAILVVTVMVDAAAKRRRARSVASGVEQLGVAWANAF